MTILSKYRFSAALLQCVGLAAACGNTASDLSSAQSAGTGMTSQTGGHAAAIAAGAMPSQGTSGASAQAVMPGSGAGAPGPGTSTMVAASGKGGANVPAAGTQATAAGSSGASGASAGSVAPSRAVPSDGFAERSDADCRSSAGAMKQDAHLPDPFMMHDGTRVTSKADWRCRRSEIQQDLEKYEIGPKPEPPMVEASYSGGKLNVKVTTSAGAITLSSTVTIAASDCVAIGMNTQSSLVTGCVQVPFMHDQVVKYASDNSRSQSDPFYKVYPELWNKVGNYAAWAWGISRLVDGLVQVKDALKIDPTKIAVHGCSYAGKMALFAGAFDERIALTIAQESGGGGINSWRTSQDFTKRTGTNVEKIDNTSGSWFLASMKPLDPYSLPHDHHELIAMVAPRALVAMGNQDYDWLGDESGWKSINAAKEVWKALGVADHIGFDFTSNHTHCSAAASQVASAKAFVDRFLKGQSAKTEIVVAPEKGNLDLDFKKSIDWQTPTLQ